MDNSLFTQTGINEDESFSFSVTGVVESTIIDNFLGESSEETTVTIHGEKQDYIFENVAASQRGGGNQARIYICRGVNDNQEYAIKIYNLASIKLEKLLPILEFLKSNKHPNITNVYEYGSCTIRDKNYYYAIMDIYEPIYRRAYIWTNEDNAVYRQRILSFVDEMNEALRFIHKQKIFHGDIKPDNIMYNPKTNKIVLIDFGGAAKALDYTQTSVDAAAGTAQYAAPESIKNGQKINTYTEYYLLGVSLAELIDGTYPGRQENVKRQFLKTKNIHSYLIPADLPAYYENLLRGLLFQDDDTERRREHRWTGEKVDFWLNAVKSNALDQAASKYKVPGVVVQKEEQPLSEWDFGGPLTLEVGADELPYTFRNLTEMADKFLTVDLWRDAIQVLLNGEAFSENNVKSHVLHTINKGIERMQNVSPSNGQTVNAEFFKFMFKYVSDKQKFVWVDLPDVKNAEEFALKFREILLYVQENDGFFGQWWKFKKGKKRSKAVPFAEIFRNKVFSFYLKRADIGDAELLHQCAKVESIFQNLKENYTNEEVSEMFLLQRMLMQQTSYKLPNKTEYENYDAFLKDIKEKAYDVNKVKEAKEIMDAVKKHGVCCPDFLAWKAMWEK